MKKSSHWYKWSFYITHGRNPLVLIWLQYMDAYENENVIQPQSNLWVDAAQEAVCHGNKNILEQCRKNLKQSIKQKLIFDLALHSIRHWQRIRIGRWKTKLLSNESFQMQSVSYEYLKLPFYYSELLRFFLSEMCEAQQVTFFQTAFQNKCGDYVLECLLDWPHYDYFLLTVRRLWGIMPMDTYVLCLLAVARKYSGDCERSHSSKLLSTESHYYDYRTLIQNLWKETPKDYKRYLFSNEKSGMSRSLIRLKNDSHILFYLLLSKSPFQEKDEALFRKIWHDLLPEEKTLLMYSDAGPPAAPK